jgi:hypothetical protein
MQRDVASGRWQVSRLLPGRRPNQSTPARMMGLGAGLLPGDNQTGTRAPYQPSRIEARKL